MNRQVCVLCILLVAVMADPARGDYITSGYSGTNQVGSTAQFKGIDLKWAAGPTASLDDPPFPPRDWLFEIDNLTAANQGDTWIADETHPNFASFEAYLTDGIDDFVYARWFPHEPAGGSGESGLSTYYFLNGLDAPVPSPGDPVDLQGYDLTEVHLTLEEFVFDSKEIFSGFIVWGYQYEIRVDFYDTAVPAPSALALFGLCALRRRRRRA